jgi:hypothetical protein
LSPIFHYIKTSYLKRARAAPSGFAVRAEAAQKQERLRSRRIG